MIIREQKHLTFALCAFIALTLAACSNNLPIKHTAAEKTAWLVHKNSLKHIQGWQFSGRFGAKTDTENWTGSIAWSQEKQQYKISIAGPLSSGSLLLEGEENFAQLQLTDDQSFTDSDPQTLLQNHTGLKLPIHELRYWLLGLPDPQNKTNSIELNEKGQISKLTQNNWEINFKRYTTVDNFQLPDKIFLVNHEINVRLIIQKWQILS